MNSIKSNLDEPEQQVKIELKEVSKEIFFKTVGPLDVVSSPQGMWNDLGGYRTIWRLRNRKLVGKSEPASYGSLEDRYFLVQEFLGESVE